MNPLAEVKMNNAEIAEFLDKVPLFHGLSRHHRELLAAIGEQRNIAADHYLVLDQQFSDGFFILLSGEASIEISMPHGQGREPVAKVRAGETLGELALLGFKKRTASARAVRSVQTFYFKVAKVDEMFAEHADAARTVLRNLSILLAQRLISTTKDLGHSVYQSMYLNAGE
jgi:CRP-like cAMP-binding protein